MLKIGIDVGSTTTKLIALNESESSVFSRYERHHAKAKESVLSSLKELATIVGETEVKVKITGSVGMGISEKHGLSFVQEVVAAAKAIRHDYPQASSMIDIGGEDAKIVFFKDGEAQDLRMNGNCAGGTGAFIDQMAVILGVTPDELDKLAQNATHVYPIASRCGVFCKTDIQNLIAKNVPKEDIAASIFHAVAVQTVITLAHGCDIQSPVLFCGGPLTFLSALRKAFMDYLTLTEKNIILPESGTLLPAKGTALSCGMEDKTYFLSALIETLEKQPTTTKETRNDLRPIFNSEEEYREWRKRIAEKRTERGELSAGKQEAFLGIDSGSTTTKIVVTDSERKLLYTYYKANNGNPIQAVEEGLEQLAAECRKRGTRLEIKGSCSTGYGEDLIKAAFQLHTGIVETIAHYMAARYLNKDVSFILDIGGQDMKAMFINDGIMDRVEINEACSSGCGSFIETFAKTLGYTTQEFATAACHSAAPCDLGTRCTVFMNSKVKQVLRDGATVEDIAAGLAYSVVKNCLYKVLKLKDVSALGANIVVQGGTMRNDAVVRALEILAGTTVTRCDIPELMGAFGCALYAEAHAGEAAPLEDIINKAKYSSTLLHCKGCDNQCAVTRYRFANGKSYYSGNRCEKVFTNGEVEKRKGTNAYTWKYAKLFERKADIKNPRLTIGIPRCLNTYENYPFWHTLFTQCDIQVRLSDASTFPKYERSACMVMSDNICFPAKLAHSHVEDLIEKKVDRIFMPFVIYERQKEGQNSYNCPVVTGYAEVVKGVQSTGIPIDSPAINFKDSKLLLKQCTEYLSGLGIDGQTVERAFELAEKTQTTYAWELVEHDELVLQEAEKANALTIMLVGRPYHVDPLIQHKVSDMLADMGIYIITEDIVRDKEISAKGTHFLAQWAYPNRILKAAQWCAKQDKRIQFVQMTSFGCGPDAFLTDEVRDLLLRHHKSLTLLKLDDINNTGSMKLRVRSLIESLKLSEDGKGLQKPERQTFTDPVFDETCRERKILVPYFTPFLSPLIPAIMRVAGYNVENLPLSDGESCEWGLKYANNEVCYPATLIVGDVIKAFKSGKHDPSQTAIAITQTGGQCRASNYLPLIKKALSDAGYTDVPVVSFSMNDAIENTQPGFKINWVKLLPIALRAILYSDCISKFYYAAQAREKQKGQARQLRDMYLHTGEELILTNRSRDLFDYLLLAAKEFNQICMDVSRPKVGVVGEIFLKFNTYAHKNIIEWLMEQGVEIVPPVLTDFFMQTFVNRKVNVNTHMRTKQWPDFVYRILYHIVRSQIDKVNKLAGNFRYFIPFKDIFEEAEEARKVITLNAQFGEGWLLPAEIVTYATQGVNNVISLQPFGCIANHIVAKGIEKRVKTIYPHLNLLSLDFDGGVSDVNITNRALLFIDHLKNETHNDRNH